MRSAAMQSLTNDLKARYPGIVIGGVGDDAHKLRTSDHNEDDTVGSKAAQSDPDETPEHRAIDAMLGPAFSRQQALDSIREVLADPRNRERLRYINFLTTQWHVSNGFKPLPNTNDPHPTHIHFSGLASKDEDARPWLGATGMAFLDDRDARYMAFRAHCLAEMVESVKTAQGETVTHKGVAAINQLSQDLAELKKRLDMPISDEQLERVLRRVLGMAPPATPGV